MLHVIFHTIGVLLISAVLVAESSVDDREIFIYLDPFFGGKERGPVLAGKFESKELTMSLANKLASSLKSRGINVMFSREKDIYVPRQERLVKARLGANRLYIAISLNHDDKDCIRIYHPYRDKNARDKTNLAIILDQLQKKEAAEKSAKLAKLIERNLDNYSMPFCVTSGEKNNYILDNSIIPTVIIVYGIKELNSQSSYILNETLLLDIINAISGSIVQYFEVERQKGDGSIY